MTTETETKTEVKILSPEEFQQFRDLLTSAVLAETRVWDAMNQIEQLLWVYTEGESLSDLVQGIASELVNPVTIEQVHHIVEGEDMSLILRRRLESWGVDVDEGGAR